MSARERNALKRKAKQLARKGSAQPAPSIDKKTKASTARKDSQPVADASAVPQEYALDEADDVDEWTSIERGRYVAQCPVLVPCCIYTTYRMDTPCTYRTLSDGRLLACTGVAVSTCSITAGRSGTGPPPPCASCSPGRPPVWGSGRPC